MASGTEQPGPAGRIGFGLVFVACGIAPMLAAFDIGPLRADDINGPAWLGAAAGGVFILAGLAIMAGNNRPALASVFGLGILCGLAAIGNWIAFGAGERVCSGTILFWTDGYTDLACRVPFAYGAIITNSIVLLFLVTTLQRLLGGKDHLKWLYNIVVWLLIIVLLPLILPLLLVLLLQVGFAAVKTRLTTGAWPRNERFIARMQRKHQGRAEDRQS